MSDRFDHTLEHTLESKADEPGDTGHVRRIELITGTGRRRRWSDDEKARVIIESLEPGANVSEVARRNGLSPQQLFGWRREARALMSEGTGAPEPESVSPATARHRRTSRAPAATCSSAERAPAFAPVVIATCAAGPPSPPSSPGPPTACIEIVIADAVVRLCGQVEAQLLAMVLRAVRRTS